jgi:hypothetical protein
VTETKPAIRLYRIAALACLLAAATAVPARAQYRPRPVSDPPPGESYRIEGAADLWFPSADIQLSSESLGIPGSTIDFKNDLGLTDQKFPALQLTLRPARRSKFRLQFIPISYTQSAALPRTIIFNGQRYSAGLPTTSTLDWKAYRFGYEFDVISRDRGFAGFIVEAKYTDVTATLVVPPSGSRPSIDEFDRARAPIPAIGGTGRFYVVPAFSITADITGFRLPDNLVKNASGHYVDVDIYGTVNFSNHFGAKAGYRSLDLGYAFDTDAGAFTLKGLYLGVVARY